MASPAHDDMYQQALQHFQRGEWDEAATLLAALREAGHPEPGIDDLLEDVHIKVRLTSTQVTFKAPPPSRRSIRWRWILPIVVMLLLGLGGVLLITARPAARSVASQAPSPTTPPAPTATPVPTTTPAPTATS